MNRIFAMLLALLLVLGSLAAVAEIDSIDVEGMVPDEGDVLTVDGLFPLDDGLSLSDEALLTIDVPDIATNGEGQAALSNATDTVAINKTNFPDSAFRTYVKKNYDTNADGKLSQKEASEVEAMWIGLEPGLPTVKCKNVKGIEFFPNLVELGIIGTPEKFVPLTTLDISKNQNLIKVYACYTNLASVDVSKNERLEDVNFGTNKLKTLKLGKHPNLTSLVCDMNRLTKLDVSKCPSLELLQVFSNKLTALDVSKNTKLRELYVYNNALKKLDVSKCKVLEYLDCGINRISTLDVSKNTKLISLQCSSNKLTKLNLSKNKALNNLNADYNQLKTLDVSKNTKLEELYCENNKLAKLDVSKNAMLIKLWCYNNALTELDLSKNTNLVNLHCGKNKLMELDVSNCTKLETLYCEGNAITEIDFAKLPPYLRDLARNNEFAIGDGVMYIIPEDDKGLCFDDSVTLYDGTELVYQPA